MKTMKTHSIVMVAIGLAIGASAQQESLISLDCLSEKVVTVLSEAGNKTEKLEAVTKVLPGEIIQYRLVCKNTGMERADHVVIGNPLPENMVYVDGSATTQGASIEFSVDGGTLFGAADTLTVDDPIEGKRLARVEDFTHVRWNFTQPLQPDAVTEVSYRARLK